MTTTDWEANSNTQEAGQLRPAYRAWLDRFPPEPTQKKGDGKHVAVIVDNRDDDTLHRVIANFQTFLLGWRFCHINPGYRFGPKETNALMLTSAFWEQFPEEHILLFQRDAVCFQQLDAAFLRYDFIGAPCGEIASYPGDIHTFDMNGGLSLRRKTAMLSAIREAKPPRAMPEDVFFTRTLRGMGARLPAYINACSFSVESETCFFGLPFGVHGTDKTYHSDALAKKMVTQAARRGHMRELVVA